MNNFKIALIRFLKNKNTVTVIGVVIILTLLYVAYNSTIKRNTNPTTIPVAAQTIQPRTLITNEMVTTIDVPSVAIQGNVIRNSFAIVGRYTAVNSVIPAGSMFYAEMVKEHKELPDAPFEMVKEGDYPYQLSVNITSTYGNSIFPGNKIDIYMKGNNESGQVMIGKLLDNVEILAVRDSAGNSVFENTEDRLSPAFLIFGVSEELNILLLKTQYMSGVELFPVPHGGVIPPEGEMKVSTQYLVDYINANTVTINPDADPIDDEDIENTAGTIVEGQ